VAPQLSDLTRAGLSLLTAGHLLLATYCWPLTAGHKPADWRTTCRARFARLYSSQLICVAQILILEWRTEISATRDDTCGVHVVVARGLRCGRLTPHQAQALPGGALRRRVLGAAEDGQQETAGNRPRYLFGPRCRMQR